MLKLIGDAATIPMDHCKTHKEKLEKRERQQEEQSKTKPESTTPGGVPKKGNVNLCQDQPDGAVTFFFQYLRTMKVQMIHSVVTETS